MPAGFSRRLALFAIAVALVAAPASARGHRDPNATELKTVFLTKPPPDFVFDPGDGARHLHDLAGRPVILNFWASYCEPCRGELDAFAKIAPAYGKAVDVLTIDDEAPGNARKFLLEHGYQLPVIEDPGRDIFNLYSVTPIPATVIVNRNGTVSKVIVGELGWDELHADIDAELTPPPAAK
jgi:cytochrome c biogenesis protein CcmG/thiol:disulfide interchange protein DsbE